VVGLKLTKLQRESLKRWVKELSKPKEVKERFEQVFGPVPVTEWGRFASLISYYRKSGVGTTEDKLKAEIKKSYADKAKRIRLRRELIEELRDLIKEANETVGVKGSRLSLIYYQELRNQLNDLQIEIEGRTPVSVTQVFSGKEQEEKGVLEKGELKERTEHLLRRVRELEESEQKKALEKEGEKAKKVLDTRNILEELLDVGEEEGKEGVEVPEKNDEEEREGEG